MNDLISVIVPVYNIENDLLDKCISSIINQTYRNLEIIIVDDGSRKETADECDRLAETDSRIIVIHQKNKGVSAARNAGLDIANGDYIGFADPDDYLEKDMFELLYITLCQDNSDICVCGFNLVYGNGDIKKREFYSGHKVFDKQEAYKELMIDKEINSCVWNKLYKTETLGKLRFQTGKYFEDEFFANDLYRMDLKVSTVSDCLYDYRQHDNSTMQKKSALKYFDLIEAYQERIQIYLDQNVYPDQAYKVMIYSLEPLHECRKLKETEEENRKYIQAVKKTEDLIRQLKHTELSRIQKYSLILIQMNPCLVFSIAMKFRGILEKFI